MTTLAYTKGVLAADTKVCDGQDYVANVKKIRKVSGYLLGACGDGDVVYWFLNNFVPEIITEKLRITTPATLTSSDDFEGIIITPKGKVFIYTDKFMLMPISYDYVACGSGSPIALGAMAVGATAKEALRAAMKHDKDTGGRLQTISLDKRR